MPCLSQLLAQLWLPSELCNVQCDLMLQELPLPALRATRLSSRAKRQEPESKISFLRFLWSGLFPNPKAMSHGFTWKLFKIVHVKFASDRLTVVLAAFGLWRPARPRAALMPRNLRNLSLGMSSG